MNTESMRLMPLLMGRVLGGIALAAGAFGTVFLWRNFPETWLQDAAVPLGAGVVGLGVMLVSSVILARQTGQKSGVLSAVLPLVLAGAGCLGGWYLG